MKKFTSTDTGGGPVTKQDLRDIFNSEFWDVIQGTMSSYDADTQGIILSGCIISGGGPYAMTAGIVYLNGEFMRMPAVASMSLPQYIQPDTPVNDDRVFADTTTHTVAVTKSAKIASSAPGSGQYVAITTSSDPDDRRLATTGWKSIPLANGWVAALSSTPSYKISPGRVQFKGALDGTSASSNDITATGVFPSAGWNAALASVRVNLSATNDPIIINVLTSGKMNSADHANSSILCLDGLQYFFG